MTAARGLLSTRDQITERLREDVFTGRLASGEKVIEANLAERFGVSRGPIREAVSLLTSEGLFVSKQNCGVTVAPPVPESIRELVLPIRQTIEVYAFKQIYSSLGADDFQYWDGILYRMEQAGRNGEWQLLPQYDLTFHRYVLERAGSPDLLAIWQSIVTRLRAHFWDTVRGHAERNNLLYVHRHHVELLDAFRNGPKSAAVKALERHIDEN
jgi:DNA-binding GntR family transcriptional regulator